MRVSEVKGINEHQREQLEAVETKNDILALVKAVTDADAAMVISINGVVFTAPQQAAIDLVGTKITALNASLGALLEELAETDNDADDGKLKVI